MDCGVNFTSLPKEVMISKFGEGKMFPTTNDTSISVTPIIGHMKIGTLEKTIKQVTTFVQFNIKFLDTK